MRARGERGSILGQVLITSAVASLMCAAILRSRLQPALTTAEAVDRARDDLAEQAAVNRVTAVWSRLGSCSSELSSGVRCYGVGCDCRCKVEAVDADQDEARVTSLPAGGACRLTAERR